MAVTPYGWEGIRMSGLALAVNICITDLNGLYIYGLKVKVRVISTLPALVIWYGSLCLYFIT